MMDRIDGKKVSNKHPIKIKLSFFLLITKTTTV